MIGIKEILNVIAQSQATSIIGGGDSVSAVFNLGHADAINHLSTGGGATLAYLGNQPLPGLIALFS